MSRLYPSHLWLLFLFSVVTSATLESKIIAPAIAESDPVDCFVFSSLAHGNDEELGEVIDLNKMRLDGHLESFITEHYGDAFESGDQIAEFLKRLKDNYDAMVSVAATDSLKCLLGLYVPVDDAYSAGSEAGDGIANLNSLVLQELHRQPGPNALQAYHHLIVQFLSITSFGSERFWRTVAQLEGEVDLAELAGHLRTPLTNYVVAGSWMREDVLQHKLDVLEAKLKFDIYLI